MTNTVSLKPTAEVTLVIGGREAFSAGIARLICQRPGVASDRCPMVSALGVRCLPPAPARDLKNSHRGNFQRLGGAGHLLATSSGDRKPRSVPAWPAPGSERECRAGHLPQGPPSTQEGPSGPHGRWPGCVAGIPQSHGPGSWGGHAGQSSCCFSERLGGKYKEALLIV